MTQTRSKLTQEISPSYTLSKRNQRCFSFEIWHLDDFLLDKMSVNMLPEKDAVSYTAKRSLCQSILVSEVEETFFSVITLTHHHLPRLQNNVFFFLSDEVFLPLFWTKTPFPFKVPMLPLSAKLKQDMEHHLLLPQCKQQGTVILKDFYQENSPISTSTSTKLWPAAGYSGGSQRNFMHISDCYWLFNFRG